MKDQKQTVYIGTWGMPAGKADSRGIWRFELDEAALELKNGAFLQKGINVGSIAVARDAGRLYCTDERKDCKVGAVAGGGRVLTMEIQADGGLKLLNEAPSYGVFPCYVECRADKDYLVVANVGSRHPVEQVRKGADGTYEMVKVYDSSTVVLYHRKDGTPDRLCDVYVAERTGEDMSWQAAPHVHSVLYNPQRDTLVACNRGGDEILNFRIRRETGELELIQSCEMPKGSGPRYPVVSLDGRYLIVSNEIEPTVSVCRVEENGQLTYLEKYDMTEGEQIGPADTGKELWLNPADIQMHPNGKTIYASLRGVDTIITFALDQATGKLTKLQTVSSEGENPRSLRVSPDGNVLLCANMDSSEVTIFQIGEDGTLAYTGHKLDLDHAATLCFG